MTLTDTDIWHSERCSPIAAVVGTSVSRHPYHDFSGTAGFLQQELAHLCIYICTAENNALRPSILEKQCMTNRRRYPKDIVIDLAFLYVQ
jgi:hypothetical protein